MKKTTVCLQAGSGWIPPGTCAEQLSTAIDYRHLVGQWWLDVPMLKVAHVEATVLWHCGEGAGAELAEGGKDPRGWPTKASMKMGGCQVGSCGMLWWMIMLDSTSVCGTKHGQACCEGCWVTMFERGYVPCGTNCGKASCECC